MNSIFPLLRQLIEKILSILRIIDNIIDSINSLSYLLDHLVVEEMMRRARINCLYC